MNKREFIEYGVPNTELIEVGEVFKNYKALCERLGESPRTTNSKKAHVKNWECYFTFAKDGHKIIIKGIFQSPKDKVDFRAEGGNTLKTPLRITNPLLSLEWSTTLNESPLSDTITRRSFNKYWWTCNECGKDIYQSPVNRINYNIKTEESLYCDFCNLSKNAKKVFILLRDCNIHFEQEYTFEGFRGIGGRSLRFDFAIFNGEKELVALIEYDGEFHDEKNQIDKSLYHMVSTHDQLKNEYCMKNSIPLLRIRYDELDGYELSLYSFLCSLGLYEKERVANDWKKSLIDDLKEKVIKLEQESSRLNGLLEVWS